MQDFELKIKELQSRINRLEYTNYLIVKLVSDYFKFNECYKNHCDVRNKHLDDFEKSVKRTESKFFKDFNIHYEILMSVWKNIKIIEK